MSEGIVIYSNVIHSEVMLSLWLSEQYLALFFFTVEYVFFTLLFKNPAKFQFPIKCVKNWL